MEIINVIVVNQEGVVHTIDSFTNVKKAEDKFLSMLRYERISSNEQEIAVEDGYYNYPDGGSICLIVLRKFIPRLASS